MLRLLYYVPSMKNRLKEILKEEKIPQIELAKHLGVRPHVVWRWTVNQVQPRSKNLRRKIANFLKLDLDKVFYIDKNE